MREFTPEERRVIKRIREVIDEVSGEMGIKVDRVILFGSRVRGDYREDSDWDILVVVEEPLPRKTQQEFSLRIRRKLVKERIIPELVITDKMEFEENKSFTGFVYYHALAEGVPI